MSTLGAIIVLQCKLITKVIGTRGDPQLVSILRWFFNSEDIRHFCGTAIWDDVPLDYYSVVDRIQMFLFP